MRKYLVITGGSRGIGKKTAALFSERGFAIINLSRHPCDLPGVLNIEVDLAKEDSLQAMRSAIVTSVAHAEKICLVHNAAAYYQDAIGDLTAASCKEALNVNVVAPVVLSEMLLPKMPSGSSIIYIGSTLSEQAVPGRASYVISKHAVVGMMRATCQDLAEKGIHTCCVCPGFVNTTMLTDGMDTEKLHAFIRSKVIAGRLIEPEEIATFIYFCMENPIVNGAVLHTNLGQVMS